MAKNGVREISESYTQVWKDGEQVGSIVGDELKMVKGNKPKLESDNSWSMRDELVGLGYTIKDVRVSIYEPITKPSMSACGSLSDLTAG